MYIKQLDHGAILGYHIVTDELVEQVFMKFDTDVCKKLSSHFTFGKKWTNMTDTYKL